MKKTFTTLSLLLLMAGAPTTFVNAADTECETPKAEQQKEGGRHRQRLTREQLAEKQGNFIAQQLGFDQQTSKRFMAVYEENQKEIWEAAPRPEPRDGQKKEPPQQPSDADSEKQIKEDFARSEKILAIRQKYYKEYSKFLTQQQIQRMYEIERQMHDRFARRGGEKRK